MGFWGKHNATARKTDKMLCTIDFILFTSVGLLLVNPAGTSLYIF